MIKSTRNRGRQCRIKRHTERGRKQNDPPAIFARGPRPEEISCQHDEGHDHIDGTYLRVGSFYLTHKEQGQDGRSQSHGGNVNELFDGKGTERTLLPDQ